MSLTQAQRATIQPIPGPAILGKPITLVAPLCDHAPMPLLPREPDHDIDAELRRLITREEGRMILEAAPVAGDWDDPEV